MKIYLFSANYFEYTIELANEMSGLGTVVLSLPENRITEKHRSLISDKVLFEPFHWVDYKSLRDNVSMFYSIAKIIRKHKPDVVHLQSHGLKNFWWLLPFLAGKKLVNTIHDPSTHSGDLISKPSVWNNSAIDRFTDQVIVHGNLLKKETLQNFGFGDQQVTVIPHGHLGLFKAWRTKSFSKEPQTFLFFGRIWPYKGLQYFIEAANLLAKERKDVKFVIAGKGEDFEKYKQQIQSPELFEIRNKRIAEEEIDELFQKAFCTVLPYIDATQSGVIPVAFPYHTLVLATHVGSLPEVVEDNVSGILIEPKNSHALFEKMKWTLDHPKEVKQLVDNAYTVIHEKLSWSTIARQTFVVYKRA